MESEDQFIEEMGMYFESHGVPRMGGRMLAWLLICDPPEQTMQEIGARLRASKGSVSTMARLLMHFDLLQRISKPGQRADLYRAAPDFGERLLVASVVKIGEFRKLCDGGLAALEGESPARRRRLEEVRDVNLFLEERYSALLAEWRKERVEVHL